MNSFRPYIGKISVNGKRKTRYNCTKYFLVKEFTVGITSEKCDTDFWYKLLSNQVKTSFKCVTDFNAASVGKQFNTTNRINRQKRIRIQLKHNILVSVGLVLCNTVVKNTLHQALINFTGSNKYSRLQKLKINILYEISTNYKRV